MASELIRKAKVPTMAGADAVSIAAGCDQCGDSLAGLRVVRRPIGATMRAFCCNGCAFIAEQLFLAHAGSRDRALLNASIAAEAEATSAAMEAATAAGSHLQLSIRGMVCGACALMIEQSVRMVPGVVKASVDFATHTAYIAFDPKQVTRGELQRAIERAGYDAGRVPRDDARIEAQVRRVDLLRVVIAWLAATQVLMLSLPLYVAGSASIGPEIERLLQGASFVLILPSLLFSAQPLYRAAWSQLRMWRMAAIGLELPAVTAISVAIGASAFAAIMGRGAIYFDAVALVIAFAITSRWVLAGGVLIARAQVEAARRQSTSALRLVAFPSSLATESVTAHQMKPGARLLVPPGEAVPSDGVVVHGRSSSSQASLTGESLPVEKSAGAPVLAGAINLDQPLVIEVGRSGTESSSLALQRMAEDAGRERPRTDELAARLAAPYLWLMGAATLLTLLGWLLVDPSRAVASVIAVLIAACPCALLLAAPAATAAAQSSLARRGVLIARTCAIEALASADLLACDKTGTLTTGEPRLLRQLLLRTADPEYTLAIAAAMETLSTHPYARALIGAVQSLGKSLPPLTDGRVEASAGIEATVSGRRYRLGKMEFALVDKQAAQRADVAAIAAREGLHAASVLVLADAEGAVALFVFGERLRDDAALMIDTVAERGVEPVLLSGDRRGPVHAVAASLGIERALAHQTPHSKCEWVAGQQRAGHRVAMFGDGINDAPALARADVSIALGDGSATAQQRADVIVQSSRLADIEYAFTVARRAMRLAHQNLGLALGCNLSFVALAALGITSPAVAVAGTAGSALLVLGNGARLLRSQDVRQGETKRKRAGRLRLSAKS
ncbi:MAG TPA: cation-translocating P-type ATPase [Burkholderiaceae bacterium]|nr:cation-translocating P-type ATPase [Burkholderiaceae bacterium]